jgi:cation:H+ antiporter
MMLVQTIALIAGLAMLYWGAERVVEEASRIAQALGISALVIGLTVVSLGTSAPELVVGAIASLRQQGELVVGNVVGSNVANLAVILGLTALIAPVKVDVRLVRREIPLMIGLSMTMLLLAVDSVYSRAEGLLLLIGLLGFLGYMAVGARRSRPESAAAPAAPAPVLEGDAEVQRLRSVGLLLGGLAALLLGARLLVGSASYFAAALGVSEVVIGIVVVAIGTSLPELATSVVAAVRREVGLAIGNAVGSNIFNILAVLGVAAVLRPIVVPPDLLLFELPAMVLIALLVLALALVGNRLRLGRWEGALLLASYGVFAAMLLQRTALAG